MEYYKNLDLKDIVYFCDIDLTWKTEQWNNVEGYEKIYMISDLGRVKSLGNSKKRKEKILKGCINKYCCVRLSKNNKSATINVHKLVAMSFLGHIPCGHNLVINHKNFNRLDNRCVNLELITQRENTNKKHIKSKSKYTGVFPIKSSEKGLFKWGASIYIKPKRFYLGSFETEELASEAYQNKLLSLL